MLCPDCNVGDPPKLPPGFTVAKGVALAALPLMEMVLGSPRREPRTIEGLALPAAGAESDDRRLCGDDTCVYRFVRTRRMVIVQPVKPFDT